MNDKKNVDDIKLLVEENFEMHDVLYNISAICICAEECNCSSRIMKIVCDYIGMPYVGWPDHSDYKG